MFVKICGTTNLPDAELSVRLGADALGFIFAPSKRRVSAEQVAEIARQLPMHVLRVGVFTEPDVDEIARAVRVAGLTGVQMHWSYDGAIVDALRKELGDSMVLWQTVGVAIDPGNEETANRQLAQQLRAALLDGGVNVVLLDAISDGASGGLGRAFSWSRASSTLTSARRAAEEQMGEQSKRQRNVAVAGGLRPETVRDAVAALRPWAVDVVSGVEASPGRKHPQRLENFLQAAREAGKDFSTL